MNKAELIGRYDQDQRKEVEYPDMRREVAAAVVRHVNISEAGGEGTIVFSELNESNADETIGEQVRYFESIGQDFEWKLYDYDPPADLKERLLAYGFASGEAEAIMVLDLADAPDIFWQPVEQRVERISDAAKLADVQSVEAQVWGEDVSPLIEYLRETISKHPDQMSVYLASVNGQPASAAWAYFPKHSQFASLWGGSTLSEFRQQGLYTALLAARAQEARARQVRYLTVDASPMSRPILEKMGFELIAISYPCKWKCRSKG
ncbi:MAG: GNAT family N-acetyltransferase [Anaerolineaceae bacterium]|nr:GNAT family N-acetyltransferase [Anaerolineaceae bacterium]